MTKPKDSSGEPRDEAFGKAFMRQVRHIRRRKGLSEKRAGSLVARAMRREPPRFVQQIKARSCKLTANANGGIGFEPERRQQVEQEDPRRVHFCVATAEKIRRLRGLLPRSVALLWTKLDDNRSVARIIALACLQQSAQFTRDDSVQSYPSEEGGTQS